jgi:hypothetical protein
MTFSWRMNNLSLALRTKLGRIMVMKRTFTVVLLLILAGGLYACSSTEADYEAPEYTVLHQHNDIQLRSYAPMLLAEVTLDNPDRGSAGNEAFRILFDYISGNNIAAKDIAMTVPVTQTPDDASSGQTIPMTVPVTQTPEALQWRTSFRLPSSLTLSTAPKPKDTRIRIYKADPQTMAAIRFSGFWSDSNIRKHKEKLEAYIVREGLDVGGPMQVAFYNDPFTWPWARRNEVLYPIKR